VTRQSFSCNFLILQSDRNLLVILLLKNRHLSTSELLIVVVVVMMANGLNFRAQTPSGGDDAASAGEFWLLDRFWLSGQANSITQYHPTFQADYSGPNSNPMLSQTPYVARAMIHQTFRSAGSMETRRKALRDWPRASLCPGWRSVWVR
jgi:hypothetical protein